MVAGDDGGSGSGDGSSSSSSRGLRTGLPSYTPRVSLVLLLLMLMLRLRLRLLLLPLLPLLRHHQSSRSSAFHSHEPQFAGVPHQLRISSNDATSPTLYYLFSVCRRILFFR